MTQAVVKIPVLGEEFQITSEAIRDIALEMQSQGFIFAAKDTSSCIDEFNGDDWQFNLTRPVSPMAYMLIKYPGWYRKIPRGGTLTVGDYKTASLMSKAGCRFVVSSKNNGTLSEVTRDLDLGGWIYANAEDTREESQFTKMLTRTYMLHAPKCPCACPLEDSSNDVESEISCLCRTVFNDIAGGYAERIMALQGTGNGGSSPVEEVVKRIAASIQNSPALKRQLQEVSQDV